MLVHIWSLRLLGFVAILSTSLTEMPRTEHLITLAIATMCYIAVFILVALQDIKQTLERKDRTPG